VHGQRGREKATKEGKRKDIMDRRLRSQRRAKRSRNKSGGRTERNKHNLGGGKEYIGAELTGGSEEKGRCN